MYRSHKKRLPQCNDCGHKMIEAFTTLGPLLAPVALLFVRYRHLRLTILAVLAIQVLCLWLSGCITSSWQCTDTCAKLYPICEDPNDDNDAAPLGIALIAGVSVALTLLLAIIRSLHTYWSSRRTSIAAK